MAKKKEPSTLIHVDVYLATKTDVRQEVKAGFKIFMRGRSYQYSLLDFDKELAKYFKRKI